MAAQGPYFASTAHAAHLPVGHAANFPANPANITPERHTFGGQVSLMNGGRDRRGDGVEVQGLPDPWGRVKRAWSQENQQQQQQQQLQQQHGAQHHWATEIKD